MNHNVIEFLDWLDEDDPKKRVEILCIWIKQHFMTQVEDSMNLVREGIMTEWILQGLHKDNTDLAGDMVKQFNDYDNEVHITRLEINTDAVIDHIKNDERLYELVQSGKLLDIVNEKTVISADYVHKEE